MHRRILSSFGIVLLLAVVSNAQTRPAGSWRFAVSGDSRNCGDIVMPAIAKNVGAHNAEFYWHLGDFRKGYAVDEDMQAARTEKISIDEYHQIAWDDFIQHQVMPFRPIIVHLGIGNHEMYLCGNTPEEQAESHADFITKFAKWTGDSKTAYYHWKSHEVDFITMDNSGNAGFDDAQIAWLEQILDKDRANAAIQAIVVGMHRALPNSLACGHSMNGDPNSAAEDNQKSLESGRRAYEDLWDLQNTTKKHVYLIASHSHFYMENIFNTAYWHDHGGREQSANSAQAATFTPLEGWLVGTAGAQRYRLPDKLPADTRAITYAYGYLLGTVHRDGRIDFKFEQIVEDDVPRKVSQKYGDAVNFCFLGNRDDSAHTPVDSCNQQ